MLQIRDVVKTYTARGVVTVRALDHVSIDFPEKGMVFLLGKSGSGKSTLLNVAGGLDSPDSGEILVKGKSSKNFSQSDFDSYRNTLIGFIFQEYNVLGEFTVEDNIALALELQGKPKDRQAIEKILEQVDMKGLASRKPNTLSGGQKQRVAIARALVKNPEIIMADEPTGALDSGTGRQVLDTLKRLSQDKLVVIVSHDREFAEYYADRIIELSDGKVISDVTRTQENFKKVSNHVLQLGEDMLALENGGEADADDQNALLSFLSEDHGSEPVLVCRGKKQIDSFLRAGGMTLEGGRDVFRTTNENASPQRSYTPEESRFIRSRLPMRHALRIGAGSLKVKPFRLIMTIFLSTVAFVLFGLLASMMAYEPQNVMKRAYRDAIYQTISIKKNYRTFVSYNFTDETDFFISQALFGETEVQNLRDRFNMEFLPLYGFGEKMRLDLSPNLFSYAKGLYYRSSVSGIAPIQDSQMDALGMKLVAGRLPSAADEVAVSEFTYGLFASLGYTSDRQTEIRIQKPEDLVGKTIQIEDISMKITGVLNCGSIPAEYDALKNANNANESNVYFDDESQNTLYFRFLDYLSSSFHNILYVHDSFYDAYHDKFNDENEMIQDSLYKNLDGVTLYAAGTGETLSNLRYMRASDVQLAKLAMISFDGSRLSSLSDHQIVIDMDLFARIIYTIFYGDFGYAQKNEDLIEQFENGFLNMRNPFDLNEEAYAKWIETLNQLLTVLDTDYNRYINGDWRRITIDSDQSSEPYTIVGLLPGVYSGCQVYADEACDRFDQLENPSKVEYVTAYKPAADAKYSRLLTLKKDGAQIDRMVALHFEDYAADDTKYVLSEGIVSEIETVSDIFDVMEKIFFWVGLVLAVFAALLLFNFISVSITYRKKEIGILRAVGARSHDVFRIFFSESLMITLICVVLASIGTGLSAAAMNRSIVNSNLIRFDILIFGVLQILVIAGIALAVAVISTFIPVWLTARRKPVEAIRAQ